MRPSGRCFPTHSTAYVDRGHVNLSDSFITDVVAFLRQTTEGTLLECNDACARILGYASAGELKAHGLLEYANRSDLDAVVAALDDLGTLANVELALRRRDGTVAWVLQNLRRTVAADGSPLIEAAMFDVTEQRVATQRFEWQAYHDGITGLPNRTLFIDRANVALAQSRRRGDALAVAVLDVDAFAAVTAQHGRGVADRLLRAVAERINRTIREEDAVAHLGDDQFMVLLAGMPNASDAATAASRLLHAMNDPIDIAGVSITAGASIGIAVAGLDAEDIATLVRHATSAAASARERGGNSFRFYRRELDARAVERATILARLRHAIDAGELELFYQPAVDVQTGTIDCFEALLRWRHPDLGLIPAADFLPSAEQGGLLGPITEIVMAKAFRQLRQWQDAGHPGMRVGVNLMTNQLGDRHLPALIGEAATEFSVAPSSIEIEFPEAALANTATREVLQAFKDLDLLLAVEDFGTSGCAIGELRRLPIDTIKIAPMLVRNLLSHHDDAAIVQAMITSAKGLGRRIVADGVETKEQFSWLLSNRCNEMQGRFVAKPAPPCAFTDVLGMLSH
jgi:diguanylate cyclase (GGDEF)-like protein/PAS domain S-box-containing protein